MEDTTQTKPQVARIMLRSYGGEPYIPYMNPALMPIENTPGHLGILLINNYHPTEDGIALNLVNHIRIGKNKKIEPQHWGEYNFASIEMQNGLYIVKGTEGEILPVPSKKPFTLCEITGNEYGKLTHYISSISSPRSSTNIRLAYRKIINEAVDFLSERVDDFGQWRMGVFGQLFLVTPPGYADQEQAWLDMPERARIGMGDR